MKKFTKGLLIVCLLLVLIGTGCIAAGFIMGIEKEEIRNLAGKYIPDSAVKVGTAVGEQLEEEIFDQDDFAQSSEKGYQYSRSDVDSIELEVSGMECTICAGDTDDIVVLFYGTDKMDVKLQGQGENRLLIERKSGQKSNGEGAMVLQLPKNFMLTEFELEADAGAVTIECPIQAKRVSLDVGAASVRFIEKVTAEILELETGSGQTYIGQVDAQHIDLENDAGETTLGLIGQKDQYCVTIDADSGDIVYGDEVFSGSVESYQKNPEGASRQIVVEAELGEVRITFQ